MQRHEPPQRDGLAVRRHHVHGRGYHGHVAEPHRCGEGAGAAADVEAEAQHRLRGRRDLKQLLDREIQISLIRIEPRNITRRLEAEVRVLFIQAIERFALVMIPNYSVVREGGREGVFREGIWGNLFLWCFGEAAAAGEGVAAAED